MRNFPLNTLSSFAIHLLMFRVPYSKRVYATTLWNHKWDFTCFLRCSSESRKEWDEISLAFCIDIVQTHRILVWVVLGLYETRQCYFHLAILLQIWLLQILVYRVSEIIAWSVVIEWKFGEISQNVLLKWVKIFYINIIRVSYAYNITLLYPPILQNFLHRNNLFLPSKDSH